MGAADWDALFAAEQAEWNQHIRSPYDAMIAAGPSIMKAKQEQFIVLTLNGAHRVIRKRIVTRGTANRCIVHPREVYRGAIKDNAVAIVALHNHPSGAAKASPEDDEITKRLKAAGDVLGIPLLDHVIIARGGMYSYLEHGGL